MKINVKVLAFLFSLIFLLSGCMFTYRDPDKAGAVLAEIRATGMSGHHKGVQRGQISP